MSVDKEPDKQAVCGQAHAVYDNLARSQSLPPALSLSIEEILERAWEIAYHRQPQQAGANVVNFAKFRERHRVIQNQPLSAHS